jgi:uncharacterized protein GlcG (DUF336 family)
MRRMLAVAAATVLVSGVAQAQGTVQMPKISAALANELVGETVAQCAKNGYRVWAVVVDLDGVRQAVLRGDGAPIHSQDNAFYKAYTLASMGPQRKETSTKQISDRISKSPASPVPVFPLPNVTYAQGALAILSNGEIIGALGVSGAPGGQFDEDCARYALDKIKDRLR